MLRRALTLEPKGSYSTLRVTDYLSTEVMSKKSCKCLPHVKSPCLSLEPIVLEMTCVKRHSKVLMDVKQEDKKHARLDDDLRVQGANTFTAV